MIRDLFTLGLGVGAILVVTQARAEGANCAERADLVARLAQEYGEHRQAAGLAGGDGLLELFAAPSTGTWTITVTRPDGISCLLAVGEHFTQFKAEPEGDPA